MTTAGAALRRSTAGVVLAVALGAGCSGGGTPVSDPGPLTGVCPDPLVIQSDWFPDAEHGAIHHLLDGDRVAVDGGDGVVRGPLVSGGDDMGVTLEIRAGGAHTDHTDVPALLHRDADLFMGVVATEQAIRTHERFPTVAVIAPLERDPLMIMWDPDTYEVEAIIDLPPQVPVSVFGPAPFVDHLLAEGIIDTAQVDPTYAGTPSRFVNSGGTIAQQGTATAEPYVYEHLEENWARPVRFQLLDELGWEVYAGTLAVTPAVLEGHAECLRLLVPILQRAIVDYLADPDDTNALVSRLVDRFDAGFDYPEALAAWSVGQQRALGVVDTGPPVGAFDLDRIERSIGTVSAVLGIGQDLVAEDLVTNEFIDPSIGVTDR